MDEVRSRTRITNTILSVCWTTHFIWYLACCKWVGAKQGRWSDLYEIAFSTLSPRQAFSMTKRNSASSRQTEYLFFQDTTFTFVADIWVGMVDFEM